MIVFSVALTLLLVCVLMLIPLGLRAGDKPGDALLLAVEPQAAPRGASVTITNPGEVAVIVGLSLRRRGVRLRLEGESYTRLRTSRTAPELLPASQAAVGVVTPDEPAIFSVPADARLGRRAELVVVVGQRDRLRTIHRLVRLPEVEAPKPAGLPSRPVRV